MKNELSRRNAYNDFDFFDEAMHDFFPAFDIKETDDAYVMEVEMPGLDKKDIGIELKDGYLNISVNKSEKEEGGKKDNYIHRERSYSCQRGYYVGDVRKEDIKAKYENGMLNVTIPKEAPKQENQHFIEIE